jgi:hypothetical protein
MAKPIIGMIPPGGWHYYDGDVKLIGNTYGNLIEVVTNYRAENHIPIGDIEGDVNSYICSKNPNYCHGVDMVTVKSVNPPNQKTELLNDITVWAKNTINSNKEVKLVSNELAEQRAKICLYCKYNYEWRGGCGACVNATERLLSSIRNAKETKSSKHIGGCKLLRHDNKTAVFLNKENITSSNSIPRECWLNS